MIELYSNTNISPVTEVQYYLREISKYRPEIPLLNPDGIYESKTKEAVTEFQKIYNLTPTGIVDLITWNTLVNEYSKCKNINSTPNKLECFPTKLCEVKQDDECDIVFIIQILINNFNRKYKNYNKLNITGKYNYDTEDAIKKFQVASKLPVTGIVNKETWNSLSTINNICKLYDYFD